MVHIDFITNIINNTNYILWTPENYVLVFQFRDYIGCELLKTLQMIKMENI